MSHARTAIFVTIAAAVTVSPALAQFRGGHGGGAPAMAAPHFSAPAAHFSAPAAPHFSAPAAPRFSAPAAPRVAAPAARMAAPHVAPHVASPRVTSAPQVAPRQFARP